MASRLAISACCRQISILFERGSWVQPAPTCLAVIRWTPLFQIPCCSRIADPQASDGVPVCSRVRLAPYWKNTVRLPQHVPSYSCTRPRSSLDFPSQAWCQGRYRQPCRNHFHQALPTPQTLTQYLTPRVEPAPRGQPSRPGPARVFPDQATAGSVDGTMRAKRSSASYL